MQEHYDDFFEEVFVECEDGYGEIEELNVCDNLGDHLVGNVYIKFRYESDAEKAATALNNRNVFVYFTDNFQITWNLMYI